MTTWPLSEERRGEDSGEWQKYILDGGEATIPQASSCWTLNHTLLLLWLLQEELEDFPVGPVVNIQPASIGDTGLIPGLGTKIPLATTAETRVP